MGPVGHPAVAVLIGGAVVLVLYVVPVLGFLVYKLLGFLGLGRRGLHRDSGTAQRDSRREVCGAAEQRAPAFTAAATASATAPQPISAQPRRGRARRGTRLKRRTRPPQRTGRRGADCQPRRRICRAPGFLRRMAALLIDVLLVGVLLHVLRHHHLELLVLAAYGAVMWKLRGSTVGGIVFDLQRGAAGRPAVDWETAIIRALSCFLSLAVAGLGFFWIAFDDNSRPGTTRSPAQWWCAYGEGRAPGIIDGMISRRTSLAVKVGAVTIGGNAPIVVQSMTNTDTADIEGTVAQVKALARAGSELVRVTVNNDESAAAVPHIRERLDAQGISTPLVGDFHFNGHKLLKAHPACAEALGKLRINPGNVGRGSKRDPQFAEMIETACSYGKPVRIGVNWGSLDQDLLTRMMDENSKLAAPLAAIDVMREAIVVSALDSAQARREPRAWAPTGS